MENDDLLVLCDLVEEYKLQTEKLQKELSYTQKELQKSSSNLIASQSLIAELEDSIYYLDDDINAKNDLLQRLVCVLDADSPAEDIVDGLQVVLTAFETGKDLNEVSVVSSTQKDEIRTIKARYEQQLCEKDEQLARYHEQITTLSTVNQQLRTERDELLQRAERTDALLEEVKASSLAVSSPHRPPSHKLQAPDIPSPYRQLNSSIDSVDNENSTTRHSRSSSHSPSTDVLPPVQRSRGAVVFQGVRSARARSILVTEAAGGGVPHSIDRQSEEKNASLENVTASSPSSSSSSSSYGRYRTTETETSTLHPRQHDRQHDRQRRHYHASDTATHNDVPMKPTPLSFSHPKFKRDVSDPVDEYSSLHTVRGVDVVDDDDDCCFIKPQDLRHSHRSYSTMGSVTSSPLRR